ncbi:MAG: FAD-dependent oxidoreductase [Clostridia bacterium]|nr:FAD-dependent oxidoreductase [Clostridia bacterium]
MNFLIKDLKFPVSYTDSEAISFMKNTYFPRGKVTVYKKSVDARKKEDISFVYTFLVDAQKIPPKLKKKTAPYREKTLSFSYGNKQLPHRPVVVGAGPGGLFCAYFLAKNGYAPIVLERGEPIEERVKTVDGFFLGKPLNKESNVQFGEGGAGAFSDGKLTTRINDPLSAEVVRLLAEHSGLPHLAYQAKPHIGTDKLRTCVKNLREEIIRYGGTFSFHSRLSDIALTNGNITSVTVNDTQIIPASVVVLATGHSAKDVYNLLYKKEIPLSKKPFSVGVRVEHFRSVIDTIQYGSFAGHPNLGAADYQVFHHASNGHTAYSFCMCPGGVVVPSQSEEESILVNGMSYFARDGKNSNSALCVSVSPEDFGDGLFDGLHLIETLEKTAYQLAGANQHAPFTTSFDFTGVKPTGAYPEPTYSLGVTEVNFEKLFPAFVTEALREGLQTFEQKMPGFLSQGCIFTGVETRTSSPLRINRNEALQSDKAIGLYPCGEGAGYAGGIVSAAVDGMKIAGKIMEQFQPLG